MQTETMIPAKLWLWTTYLTPMSRDVVVDQPIQPVRHERIDGVYMGIYALDLAEGTVLATTHAGVPERFGTHYVVLGDMLQHVHPHEARELIEPVGATERMHDRLRAGAGLDSVSVGSGTRTGMPTCRASSGSGVAGGPSSDR